MQHLPTSKVPLRTLQLQLHLPFATIVKVLATMVLVYLMRELGQLAMMLLLAMMLAVSIYPLFPWLRRRHLPGWLGIVIVLAGILTTTFLLGYLVVPSFIDQSSALMERLPHLRSALIELLPNQKIMRQTALKMLDQFDMPGPAELLTPVVAISQVAVGGLATLVFVLIFTLYLLTDGPRAATWLLAFFSPAKTKKLRATAKEVSEIVSAYVVAQVLTSVICGLFTYLALILLKVPGAVMLATIAALFDVLPVLGFFLAAIPAVVLAFTVSPLTALLVTAAYIFYHAVENYLLVPKIYGKHLRVSDLVVLVSLMAAGSVGGILGAIAVLPLIASYPIIERIWLKDVVGADAVKEHAAPPP